MALSARTQFILAEGLADQPAATEIAAAIAAASPGTPPTKGAAITLGTLTTPSANETALATAINALISELTTYGILA